MEGKTKKELIAEFMGLEFVRVGYIGDDDPEDGESQWQKDNQEWFDKHYEFHDDSVGDYAVNIKDDLIFWQDDLKYDTSWDCLMPVVEKMSEFGVWNLRPGFAHFENYAGEMRESHKFTFSKSTMDFETEDDSPVEWVFIVACVCLDGIKWYNRQKEK